ncbi:MAG: hypothetical protein CMF27_06050 [Kiritimatiellaceae bacterium]|jgi:acetyl esterase/lipase|nr:hypothetical protein [Kiritimatiellaceae bacterium]|tara:strand:- start:2364 stop:3173 length:810 start_codon:yes stop_codon:yes gene_type:complete
MKYIILVLLFIQSLSGAQNRPEPDQLVLYKTTEQTPLKLHVFLPDSVQSGDPRPAILFFFGGGWNNGSPTQFYRQAQHIADRGMIACAAEYRVKNRDDVQPDSCVMDAKSAMRYLREHASDWNIDPNRIAASGGSAGGHLALATATLTEMNDPQDDLSLSTIPNALILFNPVLDTWLYAGSRLGDLANRLSPLQHIQPDMPPSLIMHGTSDATVPHTQAVDFQKAMKEQENRCELKLYEGMPHGFFNQTKYDETIEEATLFLRSLNWIE